MIEEKINPATTVRIELGMLGAAQVDMLVIYKTPSQLACLLTGRPFACYARRGNVLQFGRLLVACHSLEKDEAGDRMVATVSAYEAGRMLAYAAGRRWDWHGGVDTLAAVYKPENASRLSAALKAVFA